MKSCQGVLRTSYLRIFFLFVITFQLIMNSYGSVMKGDQGKISFDTTKVLTSLVTCTSSDCVDVTNNICLSPRFSFLSSSADKNVCNIEYRKYNQKAYQIVKRGQKDNKYNNTRGEILCVVILSISFMTILKNQKNSILYCIQT